MNDSSPQGKARKGTAFLVAGLLTGCPLLQAQAVRPESTPPASPENEEIIELSPFVVSSAEDVGYVATATLAGTRIRTELKDVGSAVSVVTSKFLQDTGSRNAADLLVYATSTEVAGQGGNFAGGGDGAVIDTTALPTPVSNTRVRGLASADNLRDFFLTDIPWDSYNTGRIDLQRGANSILFGIGSPAGIINASLNQAGMKDEGRAELQLGNFGTVRASLDFNKVLIKDQLAIRVSGLNDETKYRQKPAFRDDRRVYAALRYDPRIFAVKGAKTSLRINYEKGEIDENRPRITPPIDAITPWFTHMNRATFAFANSNNLTTFGNPQFNPYLGAAGGRIFDGVVSVFNSPGADTQAFIFAANPQNFPASDPSNNATVNGSYKGIISYDLIAFNQRQLGYLFQPFKARTLDDPSIFDFYNNLIDGPNKRNWTDFSAFNINLSQTLFDNKLGFEIAYDKQNTKWGYSNFLSNTGAAIGVDVMSTLLDGSPNPNVGRAFIVSSGGNAGSELTHRVRESVRATAFGELNFRDVLESDEPFVHVLGRHLFTASISRQENRTYNPTWTNWYIGEGYGPISSVAVGQAGRDVSTVTYLSDNLSGRTTASGINIQRIDAVQVPTSTTIKQWSTTTRSFIDYNLPVVYNNADELTDTTRRLRNQSKLRSDINSQVVVWQGYFFDGNLVPMVGWRKDVDEAYNAGAPLRTLGLVNDNNDPDFRLPRDQSENGTGAYGRSYANVSGQTNTWSVVGHTPRAIMKHVPGDMRLSLFYNRSANFQPDASRLDILGATIASPTGRTKDYGITLSALGDRISFKINRYETEVKNATLQNALQNSYLIGAGEAWGQQAAVALSDNSGRFPGGDNYGTTSANSRFGAGHILRWQPAQQFATVPDGNGGFMFTQESIDAQYDIQRAATDDWLSKPISLAMQQTWGMNDYSRGGGSWSQANVAVTGDTLSKGTEFELSANPVRGLDLAINAARTDARRLNIAKEYSNWIEQRYEDYKGPMGDMRIWGGGNFALNQGAGGTVRDKFENEVIPNYLLALALNNTSVAELRPWRFNAIANYAFQEGPLGGLNMGGSYRWEDRQVTGFKLNSTGTGYNVNDRYYGPSESAVDCWIGYQRKLTNRVNWRIQLNVRDLFASKKLIPVTVQPDGSPAAYRIPEPRTILVTNTFEF